MTTGERIREYRKKNNLTQSQLANKVNVSPQVVSNWEREYTSPSKLDLSNLSKVLGVSADFLLVNTDKPDGQAGQNELSQQDHTYDSLDEINKLVKKYGIEDMGFFDIEQWKNLSPYDVQLIEEHFKMIVKLAKKRNEEK